MKEQVLAWQKHVRQEKQKKPGVGRGCHVPRPGRIQEWLKHEVGQERHRREGWPLRHNCFEDPFLLHGVSEQMKVVLTSRQISEGKFFIYRQVSSSKFISKSSAPAYGVSVST